jgi:hypothetical protein
MVEFSQPFQWLESKFNISRRVATHELGQRTSYYFKRRYATPISYIAVSSR